MRTTPRVAGFRSEYLAGFELESRWADWDRSDFTADSRSHVSVYRLPSR